MKKPVQWLKRLFNFDSIKGGLIYSFTLLIATVILLSSLMSYQYIVYYYQKVSTSYAIQLLQTVNANIDVYISSIKSMAQLVVRNTDVNSLMSLYQIPGELTPFQKEREARLKANVADLLTTMVNTQKNVTNVAILSAGGAGDLRGPR